LWARTAPSLRPVSLLVRLLLNEADKIKNSRGRLSSAASFICRAR
jgi:hypothetical protein